MRRYVNRATELLDHLTAMQPDNKVFQVGMTIYLLSYLTNGASDEFQLKLKYEEPTTMAQVQEIAQKIDKELFDPASKKSSMLTFPHPATHPYPSSLARPPHHPSPSYSQLPHQGFLHLQCNPNPLFPNLVPKLLYFPFLPTMHSENQLLMGLLKLSMIYN